MTIPKMSGQLWEECERCGREPCYLPLHLCENCWPGAKEKKAQDREERYQEAKAAAEKEGLPELSGSPKQIPWATTIRHDLLAEIRETATNRAVWKWHKDRDYDPTPERLTEAVERIAAETECRWWIDSRADSAEKILIEALKEMPTAEQEEMQAAKKAEQEAEAAAETLVPAEHNGYTATLKLAGRTISLALPEKVEEFRLIVKGHGFDWKQPWKRTLESYDLPTDRTVEIACILMGKGYAIRCADQGLRELIKAGAYVPSTDRWVHVRWDRFRIIFPYDPGLVSAVKKIPSADFSRPDWFAAAVDFEAVLAYADEHGFTLTDEAKALAEKGRALAEEKAEMQAESLEKSRAESADIEVPAPEGLAYLPFQLAGIDYAVTRSSGVLFGDEMGLGKTIQAIGVANATGARKILVICPASLKINWSRELEKWLVTDLSVGIATGKKWPETDVVIINYDVLRQQHDNIRKLTWDLMVADEAQYLKNQYAIRTLQVLGGKDKQGNYTPPIKATRDLFLTGTPIMNRPKELWTLAHRLARAEFPRFRPYAERYCDATYDGYRWDFSGASNLEELQEKIRGLFMVRRLKKDVLPELPEKIRQIIELPRTGCTKALNAEKKVWQAAKKRLKLLKQAMAKAKEAKDDAAYALAVKALQNGQKVAFGEIAKVRHETARAKVPYIIEHLKHFGETKVICFAYHLDVIDMIAKPFDDRAVVLTGEMSEKKKQAAVDRFQNDPDCTIFVGNMQAAGVGINLTASSHEVFAEMSYVPSVMNQAEDRAHRVGQKNAVSVQHLVLEGSIDAEMSKIIVKKQAVIGAALDDITEEWEAL